jgi:hypothetical protein
LMCRAWKKWLREQGIRRSWELQLFVCKCVYRQAATQGASSCHKLPETHICAVLPTRLTPAHPPWCLACTVLTAMYKAGDTITIDVVITTNHFGRFTFRLCPARATRMDECELLERADGKGPSWDLPAIAQGRSFNGGAVGASALRPVETDASFTWWVLPGACVGLLRDKGCPQADARMRAGDVQVQAAAHGLWSTTRTTMGVLDVMTLQQLVWRVGMDAWDAFTWRDGNPPCSTHTTKALVSLPVRPFCAGVTAGAGVGTPCPKSTASGGPGASSTQASLYTPSSTSYPRGVPASAASCTGTTSPATSV